jgi:TetR/AcrR family transcriptional repressor of bet genes
MGKAALKEHKSRRTASKEERQHQLIQATIRSVAKNGLSDTTMATVSNEAGLSQGIINLHFQSKERLLVETLRFIADEYRESWERVLKRAGLSRAETLKELVLIDFKRPVCDPNKLAVWFAYWGESKSRPTYRKICEMRDVAYRKQLIDVLELLIEEGNYVDRDARTIASTLSAIGSGLWLDLLTSPRSVTRGQARNICLSYLASQFPKHFSESAEEPRL